jgi:purine-nucleoside/S-methyl-5'-thioadenosine phosphorylase / adenosine deaminase
VHQGEIAPPLLREALVVGGEVPRLEVPGWRERYGVVAGITARGDGSPGFDLGLWSAQPVAEVMRRWAAFRAAEPRFSAVCLGNQVHRTEVAWHERGLGWTILDGIDGHGTDARGILLTVTVADCVPVYLVDPARQAVALLHAGWRGASGRILERGIRLLAGHAGSAASDIIMHCGVSICGKCYEVDSQVFEAFGLQVPDGGKGILDLRAQLARQAATLGIGEVTSSPWCTAHDHDRFFSHRASAGADGRLVAYLGMPMPA